MNLNNNNNIRLITTRSLNDQVHGVNVLLRKCLIFNPYLKGSQNQDFDYFVTSFRINNRDEVKKEFEEYLLEDKPENSELSPIKFWVEAEHRYSYLSSLATTWLSLACSSLDAERSFSKFSGCANL
jgi:hypothetical protein